MQAFLYTLLPKVAQLAATLKRHKIPRRSTKANKDLKDHQA